MGKLYFYEWKKLFRQRSFLFFTLLLLLGNLFALFQYEKHTDSYLYFYRLKQEWQEYANGNENVANAGYYEALTKEEEAHVSFYGEFLNQIPEQAEKLKKTGNYQDTNTYLYRNLIKTTSDYKGLSADGIRANPSIGVKELAGYQYGIYFQLLFLFALSYFVISAERKKGLFLLTKGTRKGHLPLAAAKLFVMISASMVFGVLQECETFSFLGGLYGYGELTRKIQSVSIFRDCTVSITVLQAMLLLLASRILIGILCAVFSFFLTVSFRKEGIALLVYVAVIGLEMLLNHKIQISSSLNAAKCINLFFAWSMKNIFGTYLNLNVFGYPIDKSIAAFGVGGLLACGFLITGLRQFALSCQISSGNFVEEIREKIAKKTSFQWHHTFLYLFELKKVFMQQKRGYLCLLLLIWCFFCTKEILEPPLYDDPAEGEYHRILSQISGPVTGESLSYIEGQGKELEGMYEELEALGRQSGEQAELKINLLFHEVGIRAEGIGMVEEQRDILLGKPGRAFDKFWIDEKKYLSVFFDYTYDLTAFFIGIAALVLWMSEMEALDLRKGIYSLLYTTKAGKEKIQSKKRQVGITGMLYCVLCTLFPQALHYFRIDYLKNAGQKLSDFTMLELNTSISLGGFILLIFLIKISLFIIICWLLIVLIRKIQNAAIVIGTGIGCAGLGVLLLWYFHMDVTIFFLKMFSS